MATVVKVRMSTVTEVHGQACQSVRTMSVQVSGKMDLRSGVVGRVRSVQTEAGGQAELTSGVWLSKEGGLVGKQNGRGELRRCGPFIQAGSPAR